MNDNDKGSLASDIENGVKDRKIRELTASIAALQNTIAELEASCVESQAGRIASTSDHSSLEAEKQALEAENQALKQQATALSNQLEFIQTSHRKALARNEIDLSKTVDVIVPVYAGLEETQECIESTLASIPDWAQLVVINDCSPEPELTEWLRARSSNDEFILLENETNLGFVATVNRGMQLHLRNDVLLLNSDVEVANNWLERIKDAAYSKERVGSITPFSNNATICSFPNFCEDNELLLGLDVKALDDHFSSYGTQNNLVEIPTGIGFCMYIRRDCLNQVGYFDVETFGRGYGEENDWCQRADKLGWKNYHQLNVFAYHKGGVSFAGEQSPRKIKAMELLSELHPNYTADVMSFIAADPAKKARQQMMARIIATTPVPKVLLVSHKMGGGVVTHLNELIAHYKNKVHFLLLSPGEKENTYALALTAEGAANKDRIIFDLDQGTDKLTDLLTFVGVGNIHYHHIMGFSKEILTLHEKLKCSYDITVHDYFLINGNPTLTDRNGRFCGDDLTTMDQLCIEHYPVPMYMPLEDYRKHVAAWLRGAQRVIFPSIDTQARYANVYDAKTYNAVSAWHIDHHVKQHDMPVKAPQPSRDLNVLIIGAISKEKGAVLLEETAVALSGHPVKFTLMGYAFRPLHSAINTLGGYSDADIDKIIEEVKPDVVWYPAQWPETYSYTLSIALENGLPVIVPNIGAFPERVNERQYSRVIQWDMAIPALKEFFLSLAADPARLNNGENKRNILDDKGIKLNKEFYQAEYLNPEWQRKGKLGIIDYKTLINHVEVTRVISEQLSQKEVYLAKLWRLIQLPGVKVVARFIPYRFQRYVKRRLSNRAIHEIVK
ncbi:glycosyltransferase [Erwinia sp. 198]|uniref:glycosyltransferase n=1 Tax=Erwinia sp. 198 TaxID=2022746 RepID=UPI000F670EEC|nr:glycosyltransferase [Erwinia sp. 198]RRZ94543.1 glycosyltransferase [Erwinia sp. 198]